MATHDTTAITNASGRKHEPEVEIPDETNINAIFKAPEFWPDRPHIWFIQMEAHFYNRSIKSDLKKFNCVITSLDSKYLAEVEDAITSPPESNKYDNIKTKIIERYADSKLSKIKKLLQSVQLGDKKPSQLLNDMKRLAGNTVSDDFLKSIWLQRLPADARAIITAADTDLTSSSNIADKILEVSDLQISSVNSVSQTQNSIATLEAKINTLTNKISEMQSRSRNQNYNNSSKERSLSKSKSRERQQQQNNAALCWYHQIFGDKAKNCKLPCSKNVSDNQTR